MKLQLFTFFLCCACSYASNESQDCSDEVNLSCPSSSEALCHEQLCDGSLECDVNFILCPLSDDTTRGNIPVFDCGDSPEYLPLTMLCDGNRDCENSFDELNILCTDKCLHPYYGGCSKTRLCTSTENGTICGSCLFGYEEDPEDPSGDCIPSIQLSLESTTYRIREDVGVAEVCANITWGSTGNSSFEANFIISSQSAVDGIDFTHSANAEATLDFSDAAPRHCINITVIDDSILEPEESFAITLRVNVLYVALAYDLATVVIEDNELMIGFESESHTEGEGNNDTEVCISVQQGSSLDRSIPVYLATVGESYTAAGFTLIFDSMNSRECVSIEAMRGSENVYMFIFTSDNHVVLNPNVANITYSGAGGVAKNTLMLVVGISTAIVSGVVMFCVGVLAVNARSWMKRKHPNREEDKEFGEKEEGDYDVCTFPNVDGIPTSINAAYVRGDSLCSSTNTSDLPLRNPLVCDEQQIQPSGILEEPIYSTAGDGCDSTPQDYEDPLPCQNASKVPSEQQCEAVSSTTLAGDKLRSSTPAAVSIGDSQTNVDEDTDICSKADNGVECIAQSSDGKKIISSSAQTPTCCACDAKQPDHPVDIQTSVSTLPSEQTSDSEMDAEDYEIAGQVYEQFSKGSGYERMGSIYESSLPRDGYERLGSVYEYMNSSGSYDTEGSIHDHVTIQAQTLSVE